MTAVEHLIDTWITWETNPSSRAAVVAKEHAIAALGLTGCATHNHIAAWRRNGYSVPDAAQSMFNDDVKEAS